MRIVDYLFLAFGFAGFAAAGWFYSHLWKWAKQCQGARISIAYKTKVKLSAPLVEWLLWCNQLDKDKDSTGRVVFRMGATSVAISKRPTTSRRMPWQRSQKAPGKTETREGTWAATDETVKA